MLMVFSHQYFPSQPGSLQALPRPLAPLHLSLQHSPVWPGAKAVPTAGCSRHSPHSLSPSEGHSSSSDAERGQPQRWEALMAQGEGAQGQLCPLLSCPADLEGSVAALCYHFSPDQHKILKLVQPERCSHSLFIPALVRMDIRQRSHGLIYFS